MTATRLVQPGDADRLAQLVCDSRDFLAPFEPARPEAYFTSAGQRDAIAEALQRHEQGTEYPAVILDESGQVAGRINLVQIIRGPLLSATLGYWLGVSCTGRGLATRAAQEMLTVAFGRLGLHRVQAGTMVHNAASQRVLERAGFTRFGLAPRYLLVAGQWQDHVLYQVLHEPAG